MLIEEARWFGQKIVTMDASSVFPMCNVGSSTDDFRRKEQPWIDEYIFKPARENRQVVKHLDIKDAPGVDIVVDLSDDRTLERLSKMGFRSVFCSNILEHVANREDVSRSLISLIPPGGYLFVSCPLRFPFHPDPIDTMFRPDVGELAGLFPGAQIYCGEIVTGGTYLDYLTGYKLAKTLTRLIRPPRSNEGAPSLLSRIPWLFTNLQATCVILRKTSDS